MADSNLSTVFQRAIAPPASQQQPTRQDMTEALLRAEKAFRRDRQGSAYEPLLGTWQLKFITGTVKTRQQAGPVLGAGRFLPGFLKITLSYAAPEFAVDLEQGRGRVTNTVSLGPLQLQLTGPTQWWPKPHSLAFDFTHLTLRGGGRKLYQTAIRGGEAREAEFYQQSLKDQAFFTYFLTNEHYIAARGRGGGLAFWQRLEPTEVE